MPVEVVHTFEEKGKSVNVATLLQCVFNLGNARVSDPFLSNVPRPLVLDALKHLDSVCLVRVPGNASVFQCWADKACIYLFSDFFIGAFGKVSSHHVEGFGTFSLNHDSLLSNSTPR